MQREETDAELVAGARAGNARAFARLVERHYPACLQYACRMLGDRADAEEAVQDAFVRAHGALHRYEDRDRFRAWLLRIVVNRCRSQHVRRRWRFARRALYLRVEAAERNGGSAPPALPEQGWSARVQHALDALSPRLREAFLLKHVEELEYEEMRQLTGASVSALKMRVKRASDRLLELLGEAGDA